MTYLFNLVLLFCSRDFIEFFSRIKGRGDLNEPALISYFSGFLLKAGFWVFLFSFYLANGWEPNEQVFTIDWLRLGSFSLVLMIILISLRSEVQRIENLALSYSDGDLIVATITEKSLWKGKQKYSLEYSVAGRSYKLDEVMGLMAGVDDLGRVGDTAIVIYAQSDPNFACLYDEPIFHKRCLIRDKIPPVFEERNKAIDVSYS